MADLSNKFRELRPTFERDGFVVIRNLLSSLQVAELQRELSRYIEEIVPKLPNTDNYYEMKREPGTLKYMSHMAQHDSYFADLVASERWKSLATSLLDDDAGAQSVEWFNKPPQVGKITPPHQDGYYFRLDPNEALTMRLALDPVDEANGCVHYIPGSQRRGLRTHGRTELLGFSLGIVDYDSSDREAEVLGIAAPGDLLVHHSMTIHRADANASSRQRRALGLVYYSAKAKPDQIAIDSYQSKLNAELQIQGKI